MSTSHGKIRSYTVRYYASSAGIAAAKYQNATGNATTANITGLSRETGYIVDVAASNRIFTGPYSDSAFAKTTGTGGEILKGRLSSSLSLSHPICRNKWRWCRRHSRRAFKSPTLKLSLILFVGLSGGGAAGIAVGCVALVAIPIAVFVFCLKSKKGSKGKLFAHMEVGVVLGPFSLHLRIFEFAG